MEDVSGMYAYKDMDSPVGRLRLIAGEKGLVSVLWNAEDLVRIREYTLKEDREHSILIETERQLRQYFEKQRTEFDLPLDLIGTDFQKSV